MPTGYRATQILTWLIAIVFGLSTLGIPTGYFLSSYQFVAGSLEAEAEFNGRIINQIINDNPTMWEYETLRLNEYLSRRPRQSHAEIRRVYNSKGDLVIESVDKMAPPIISRSLELFDSGVAVGRIEISQSLRPLFMKSVWLLLMIAPIGLGIFIILRVLPIRMLQRSEKALRESEETYRTLIDTSNDAIFVVSNDTDRIFHTNRRAEELLGLPTTEILNRSLKDVLKTGGVGRNPDETVSKDSVIYEINPGELSLIRPDGIEVIAEMSISVSEMRGKKITQCILREVTERKEAERHSLELQEKLDRAQRMEAVGLLAGGVANDLNNMLGPLVGYPELILLKLPEDSPMRRQVMRIGTAAQEAADVIQDLLTLARRGRYEMKPTDLNQVIESYLDSPGYLGLRGARPGIVVDLKLRRDIAPILGSAVHLGKVVMNLVFNAFDATGDKGNITIRTEQQSIVRLLCGYENVRQGEYGVLRVSDTGSGIDPGDIDNIFEPYFSKKKMGRSGSGLGLSVVYGTIKDHKGYYDVVSDIGKGTEFLIYIPVTTTVEPVTPEVERDYRGQEDVLVVDDSEEQLELAKELISSLGYRIATSRTGHEAINYLSNHRVDLVVLDMIMERNFDGLDTYREIVKIHPGQRAIVASGFSPTGRVAEMQDLGAGEYVKKPYTREAIGKAIRAELDKQRSTAVLSGSA